MRLRQDNLKESPGQYARGEFYRKHFSVPHKFTVYCQVFLRVPKGRFPKKNTSYSVTLSLKVGGGQDEITLLGAAKIVTS